jgi:hypothetical protein
LTKETYISVVIREWRNWLLRHNQNGKVVASMISLY